MLSMHAQSNQGKGGSMMDVGRIVVKTAGRDAGKYAVIVDVVSDGYVLIDGETRRRKCNTGHLEPTEQTIEIKKGASHDQVVKAFQKIGRKARTTKPKPKQERQKKQRKVKEKKVKETKKTKEVKQEKKVKKE